LIILLIVQRRPPGQSGFQGVQGNRLGQKVIHANGQAALAVFFKGVGRQGDDWQVRALLRYTHKMCRASVTQRAAPLNMTVFTVAWSKWR